MTCCIPTSSLLTHTPTCWGSQTSTSRSRGEPESPMSGTSDRPTSRARAFTLAELLVVLGIVSLLLALLLPVVAAARKSANRTVCRAELRQIGAMLQMYLAESNGKLPRVNPVPSVRPRINGGPSMVVLLRPYAGRVDGVYRCPADKITRAEPAAPQGYETYFEREQSSYQPILFMTPALLGHIDSLLITGTDSSGIAWLRRHRPLTPKAVLALGVRRRRVVLGSHP